MVIAHGRLVIIGKQPDGDSIRFVPNELSTVQHLPHATRLRAAKDGSLQLRLDGIDAPETHYNGQSQLLGDVARSTLLRSLGFTDVRWDAGGTVTESQPKHVPVTLLVNQLDPFGRLVSYILAKPTRELTEGQLLSADAGLLGQTVNAHLLQTGAAYLTLYNSTPPVHRDYLRHVAAAARAATRGVWKMDHTARFILTDHASIGPDAQALILPKLFRRCTDYLEALDRGFAGGLPAWIQSTQAQAYHSDDDYVIRSEGSIIPLHTLLHQRQHVITTSIDPLTDVFIEQ